MGGKAPLKSLRGLGLLCSTRTHLHEADVLGVLAEALPADVQVVLANDTPLVRTHAAVEEKGGGGSGSQSGSRVNRAKRETLEIGAACRASRDGFEPPVEPDDARSSRACHACFDCPSIASRDRRAWRRGRRAGKPPDRRVRGINTLPEGAPEAGDGDRTRHAPATLALAVQLLLGSPDVSEAHVCSEVCDACGATLKGPPGGRKVREKLHRQKNRAKLAAHNHGKSFYLSSSQFLRTFSLARFQLRCHSARCARTPSDAEVRPKRDAQFPRFPSTRVLSLIHI